jgi:hypothetical protein
MTFCSVVMFTSSVYAKDATRGRALSD